MALFLKSIFNKSKPNILDSLTGLNEVEEVTDYCFFDAEGNVVDSVAWGGTARFDVTPFTDYGSAIPSGRSLKRYPPWADRNDCSRDFYLSSNPSPGLVPSE